MPSEIGFKLNRVYRATIAPGEIGAAFLAIRLYSNPGNTIQIDGINYGVIAATTADANLVTFKTARIVRDAQFVIGTNFATTLAAAFFEEYYADVSLDVGDPVIDFQKPLILEAGYHYTLLHEGPVVSAAPAANLIYYAELRGRTVPDERVEEMPVVLRSGIAEAQPEGCVTIEGS